jgi:hypothetical protein
MLKGVRRCIVDERSSTSILSSLTWKALGSPKLLSATSELISFDRRPSECLGILPQFPISLGGKIVLVDLLVVSSPLEFNMLLGRDYVYAMKVLVSTLFCVMHFPHNRSIVTIDQLSSNNHHPSSISAQVSLLCVPSVRVNSSPPRVNYVVSVQFLLRWDIYNYVYLLETRSRQLIRCFIQWGHGSPCFPLLAQVI